MLFVHTGTGTVQIGAEARRATPLHVLQALQALGVLPEHAAVRLCHGGNGLQLGRCLHSQGVREHSTLRLVSYLRGGQPVQVQIMTGHLACGRAGVSIDITPSTPIANIKAQLEAKTGVPAKDQKLMLSSIDQLIMGDKRTNVGFGSCGIADSISFAVAKSL